MSLRIHDPGAAGLSLASAITPVFGVGSETWRWLGSITVAIAGASLKHGMATAIRAASGVDS